MWRCLGDYLVTIKFNDDHIPGSPFKVHVLPSAAEAGKMTVHELQDRCHEVSKVIHDIPVCSCVCVSVRVFLVFLYLCASVCFCEFLCFSMCYCVFLCIPACFCVFLCVFMYFCMFLYVFVFLHCSMVLYVYVFLSMHDLCKFATLQQMQDVIHLIVSSSSLRTMLVDK